MRTIHKKVWPEYFDLILAGKKKVELRLADFDAAEGDTLVLEEWDPERKEYTGRKTEATATYILKTKGQEFWSEEDTARHGFQVIQFEMTSNPAGERPKVGIGIMIFKEGKVLLGKRRGSHGAGEFGFPGGHMEHGESFAGCARRETEEESGLAIENIRFQVLANITAYPPHHYVYVGVAADWKKGKPEVREPEKCESWGWYDLTALPEPLFLPCALTIESWKTGEHYLDSNH